MLQRQYESLWSVTVVAKWKQQFFLFPTIIVFNDLNAKKWEREKKKWINYLCARQISCRERLVSRGDVWVCVIPNLCYLNVVCSWRVYAQSHCARTWSQEADKMLAVLLHVSFRQKQGPYISKIRFCKIHYLMLLHWGFHMQQPKNL